MGQRERGNAGSGRRIRRGWATLLTVLAVAGCQSASPGKPTVPGTAAERQPDALFYTKAGSLYVSAPAGTPGRRLTDGPADAQPAPSPDLTRVAFVRKTAASDYGGELWVLDLSPQLEPVGAARRLVDPAALPQRRAGAQGRIAFPRFSPTGGRVAFLEDLTDGTVDGGVLHIAVADTGALVSGSRDSGPAPFATPGFAWAPDGSRIAWLNQRSDVRPTNVNVLDTGTFKSAPVATGTNASSVAFAADGQSILFTNSEAPPQFALSAGGIYSVPTSKPPGPPTALFTRKDSYFGNLAVLDSGAMAFTASSANEPRSSIQILDEGSTEPRVTVTDLEVNPICYTTPQGGGVCHGVARPAWGPGDRLAYLDTSTERSLVVTDQDNRDPVKVDTGVESFAWAPRPTTG